ncbi:MAG: DNA/RNA nuclease SfsA [Clostridia bacterium]|nr:DNA/RNA nuclease SfsA [Clostridia bacterium]
MRYNNIVSARFVSRPNRFIAMVDIGGEVCTAHVKNTGRCRELLTSGCEVWLDVSDNLQRKTKYDLIAVKKQRDGLPDLIINMDSQIPNAAVCEWLPRSGLFSADAVLRREVNYGSSRFDIRVEDGQRKAFIEVKGVTLEQNGIAMFPDAPTQRGIKHLTELANSLRDGYEAYVVFVIQMKGVHEFRPNDITHKAFGDSLRRAASEGVRIIAVDCNVTPDSIKIDSEIKIKIMS